MRRVCSGCGSLRRRLQQLECHAAANLATTCEVGLRCCCCGDDVDDSREAAAAAAHTTVICCFICTMIGRILNRNAVCLFSVEALAALCDNHLVTCDMCTSN